MANGPHKAIIHRLEGQIGFYYCTRVIRNIMCFGKIHCMEFSAQLTLIFEDHLWKKLLSVTNILLSPANCKEVYLRDMINGICVGFWHDNLVQPGLSRIGLSQNMLETC